MKWFFGRIQEASSYGGLGLLGLAGEQAFSGNWEAAIFSALTGVIAFVKGDK